MREATAQWLNPMMDAAEAAGWWRDECHQLMRQATMPATEADDPRINKISTMTGDIPGLTHGAIDWIRLGGLIRERLGWTDYPEWPPVREMN